MAKVNVPNRFTEKTHEGAPAYHINDEQALRRSVMACLLWEKTFYEEGKDIAERIASLVSKVNPEKVAAMAIEAREKMKLRHVPLLLVRELARNRKNFSVLVGGSLVSSTLERVIQRADELAEFVALYWKEGKKPLSAQVKKGLAGAFTKFDAYQLAKYNREDAVKLRDVLFLCHAKPKDAEQAETWKKLVDGTLESPDTWEVSLSSGKDKKESWERLLSEDKLGALALLRNLRNMQDVNVDDKLIREALSKMKTDRVLPFRFIAAAKAAPKLEDAIDQTMLKALGQIPKLSGKTIVVIDVSGSMYSQNVSEKSDMNRALAACALGALARELCENPVIYATAGSDMSRIHATQLVPARRGMALVDAIYAMCNPLGGGGIFLNQVCKFLLEKEHSADRTIVITDEQDCAVDSKDSPLLARPLGNGYLLNVNTYKNGIGYGVWTHIDGWSEAVLDYIMEVEKSAELQ